jgi:hypothetical protein
MLNLKNAALGAVSIVLLSTSMATAQRQNLGDDPRLKQTAPKTETKAPTIQTSSTVTTDDLAKMLKDMGYQCKTNTLSNGAVILELDIQTNGRTCALDVELSKDKSKVWLTAWFKQMSQGETIPSHIMTQMLESNGKLGPCHFAVSTAKQVYLGCPVDNRNLSSQELRRQIDIFLSVFNQTEPLWNSGKWNVQVGGGR